MILRIAVSFFVPMLLTSCLTNRVAVSKSTDFDRPPAYTDYMDHWWWGFSGEPEFNLSRICVDQKPQGFIESKRPTDILFTAITLGIYTPSTIRVWCGDIND